MRAARPAVVLCALALAALPARADPVGDAWRATTISSGPTDREEPPHLEAVHEWWYFALQNPSGLTPQCSAPWQAMVTFVSDREIGKDMLLFTAVIGRQAINLTREFPPGWLVRTDSRPGTLLTLAGSYAQGRAGSWVVFVRSGGSRLTFTFNHGGRLWRRRAPEGGGALEITFAPRLAVESGGWLYDAAHDRTCLVTGTGYFEHVWGNWSRAPMWGVDFLNAHLANGWSAYARNTPMRGETNLYPALGLRASDYWPPVLVVSDGARSYEARAVTFTMTESADEIPELGIKRPATYTVTGSDFSAPQGGTPPGSVTLTVTQPALALVPLPLSSGLLEGWGSATLDVDGTVASGTSEVEMQRYGTRYPR